MKLLFILYLFTLASISSNAYSMMMKIFDGPPTAPQCRNCHYDLERFPLLGLYLGLRNPDRHHLLIGTTIPPRSRSKAPDALGANDSGQPYQCLSCHKLEGIDPITGERGETGITEPFRDCLQCHPAWIVTGPPGGGMMEGRRGGNSNGSVISNVHMTSESTLFNQRRCGACHSRGMGGGGRGGMGRR
ncbi:hypothetical protein MNBD_GAMMA04-535 [hydrothermal vent metagenome]|uniref:Uncharacterized protein n=1 Tax=hydrothermal vent metagenome TaxID=652676 RepID=A0A3B0WUS3_9ZZZZ